MSASDSESLRFWSFVYEFVTWLVVLGVLMEGCEIVTRRFSNQKSKKLLKLWKLDRFIGLLEEARESNTPHWAHNVGDWGFVILVFALILEPICHARIESITNKENRRLTAQLDSTTKQAAVLNDRAATNELRVAQLTNETLRLSCDLEAAKSNNLVLQSNVLALTTDSPANKPIISISGSASFVALKNALDIESLNPSRIVKLELIHSENDGKIPDIDEMSKIITYGERWLPIGTMQNDPYAAFEIRFDLREVRTLGFKKLTLKRINAMRLTLCESGKMRNMVIVNGRINLTINSESEIEFEIPMQTNRFETASSFKTIDGGFVPIESDLWTNR